MPIFRRDSPGASTPPPAENRSAPPAASAKGTPAERAPGSKVTLVARGSRIIGTITGSTEVVIEGEVEGQVDLESHVQIGTHGRVNGNLKVRSARIAGQLVGNVAGSEVVELTATGRLEGDVAAPRVVIAEGAFFRGNIEMTKRDASARPASESTRPASEPIKPANESAKPANESATPTHTALGQPR
jgi:cytoskeletal protein CcmA (bactofilin family)